MAFFSQDPNVGIRASGMGAFIPPAINSLSYKGNAGVNARRTSAGDGARRKPKMATPGVTPGVFGPPSSLAGGTNTPSNKFKMVINKSPSRFEMANNSGTAVPAPTTPTIGVRMSHIADGIVKNQALDDATLATSVSLDPSKRPLNWNGADPSDWLRSRGKTSGLKSIGSNASIDSSSRTFGKNPGMRFT